MKPLPLLLLSWAFAQPALGQQGWTETTLDSPSAKIIQETNSPGNGFFYTLRGRIKLGDSACAANGRTARLHQQVNDGVLVITPELSGEAKACDETDSDEAIYAEVQADLRGDAADVSMVMVRHVEAPNNDLPIENLLSNALKKDDVLVLNGRVTERNAGVNPDAFAISIKLNFEQGPNPCLADAYQVDLVQNVVDEVMYVKLVKTLKNTAKTTCTAAQQSQASTAVTKTMKKTIRGLKSQIRDIRIENVRSFGNQISLAKYL